MTSTTSSSAEYFDVDLAVYDLSRGMARNLSAQFLGPAHTIDLIPHTGIGECRAGGGAYPYFSVFTHAACDDDSLNSLLALAVGGSLDK